MFCYAVMSSDISTHSNFVEAMMFASVYSQPRLSQIIRGVLKRSVIAEVHCVGGSVKLRLK